MIVHSSLPLPAPYMVRVLLGHPGIVYRPTGGDDAGGDDTGAGAGDDKGGDDDAGDDAAEAAKARIQKQVQTRVAREIAAERKKILDDLGVGDLAELHARMAKLTDLEASQLSEGEKLKAELEATKAEAAKLKKQVDERAAEQAKQAIERAVELHLVKAGMVDADDDDLESANRRAAKFFAEHAADPAKPTSEEVAAFVADFKERKPAFFGKSGDEGEPKGKPKAQTGQTPGSPKPKPAVPGKLTSAEVLAMTKAEAVAHEKKVLAQLARG